MTIIDKEIRAKFLKNNFATGALIFIALISILAIIGYLVTSDKTNYANRQCIEIAAKPPGFKVRFLKIPYNNTTPSPPFYIWMFTGKLQAYEYIPIDSFLATNTEIIIRRYNDDSDGGVWENHSINKFPLANTAQAVASLYIEEHRFFFGTDRFGRDMLSRLIIGARISLAVGFIAVFISLIIGIFMGALAGYYRGKIDKAIMWLVNVIWSVPTLLMVIAITMVLGKGFWQMFIAVGLTMWVEVARVVRGQVMSIREKDYIEACRAMGFSNARIITKHVLPGVVGPVIIISAANFASAILIESGLSFLGIGIQPPMPSWGSMIKEQYGYIILDKAYLAMLPGIAIMLLTLAFTFVGNGLRDAFDNKHE